MSLPRQVITNMDHGKEMRCLKVVIYRNSPVYTIYTLFITVMIVLLLIVENKPSQSILKIFG